MHTKIVEYSPLTFDHAAAMELYTFCVEPIEVLMVFNQSMCVFFKLNIRTAIKINDSFYEVSIMSNRMMHIGLSKIKL